MSSSLEELLMVETSRRNTDLIADLVYHDPFIYPELVAIYLRNEEPVSRRAAWIVDTVSEKFPELLQPFIPDIIVRLPEFSHDGLKRHSLRILTRYNLGENESGQLISYCFDILLKPFESVAVKVHAMEILYQMSCLEPDLKKELAETIEWRMEEESAGFRNKGMKVLERLYKEMDSIH